MEDDSAPPTAGLDDILELHISVGPNAHLSDGVAGGEIRDDGDIYWPGGVNNDVFPWRAGSGEDFYDGGIGIDTINYATTILGIAADLAGPASGPEIGNDWLLDIENVIGGNGNDQIRGIF